LQAPLRLGSGSGGAGIVEATFLCKRPFDEAQGAGVRGLLKQHLFASAPSTGLRERGLLKRHLFASAPFDWAQGAGVLGLLKQHFFASAPSTVLGGSTGLQTFGSAGSPTD